MAALEQSLGDIWGFIVDPETDILVDFCIIAFKMYLYDKALLITSVTCDLDVQALTLRLFEACIYFLLFYFLLFPSLCCMLPNRKAGWKCKSFTQLFLSDQRGKYELLKGLSPFSPISAIRLSWLLWGWGCILPRNGPWYRSSVLAHK